MMKEAIEIPIEAPLFDKNGRCIAEFDVIKVFHYVGRRRKHHFMYKWVRLKEFNGKKYWVGIHLTDSKESWYRLRSGEENRLYDTEIVQSTNV